MLAILKRLKLLLPMVQIASVVFCCMVAVNFGVALVSRQFPGWLPPGEAFNGYVHDCHQRIAVAKYQFSRGELDTRQPLCVIIGPSTARQGIELSTLTELDGLPFRYMGLCAAGHKINVLASIAKPILRGDLKPELAILVVSPHQMKHLGSRVPGETWDWVRMHRKDVQCSIDRKADRARQILFDAFQVNWDQHCCALKPWNLQPGIPQTYLQHQMDPFRGMMMTPGADVIPPQQLAQVTASYRTRGYSDPKRYPPYSSQLYEFLDLIDEFHRIGTKVIVVFPPERSILRDMVVQQATANLKNALQNAYGADVPLLNCRSELPDECFVDLGHLNTSGRARFSELLAKQIAGHMPMLDPSGTERAQIARRSKDPHLSQRTSNLNAGASQ